jgi:peptidoglycan/LPS O-acetylase OafA/YrhL
LLLVCTISGLLILICAIYSISFQDLLQFPLARLFEFVIGMCGALAYQKFRGRIVVDRITGTVIEALAICLVCYALWIRGDENLASPFNFWFYSCSKLALPAAMLFFVMACEIGHISRLMAIRPLVILGEASYSIYLFHVPLIQFYWTYQSNFAQLPTWLHAVGFATVLCAFSIAVWLVVERPSRKLILRLARSRPSSETGSMSIRFDRQHEGDAFYIPVSRRPAG